jgi:hypothetical protein
MKLRVKGSLTFFLTSCRYAFCNVPTQELPALRNGLPSCPIIDPCTSVVQSAHELVPRQQGQLEGYQCTAPDLQSSWLAMSWQNEHSGLPIGSEFGQNGPSVAPAMTLQPGLGNFNSFTTADPVQWDLEWTPEDFITNGYAEQLLPPASTEPQFDFTAEAGLQQPVLAPLPASFNTPAAARQERLTCPHGCSKTFGRPGDFRRHMLKHGPPKFKCIVLDCKRTFYRADKLRQHIKQGHKLDL